MTFLVSRLKKLNINMIVHFRSVIEELHRKSLDSEEFGRKAARAFGNVSQLEVSGVKLRDVVLRNIQTDFKSELCANC